MTWQRLPGSVKYLSVYFSKCGNIFIAWSGSSVRMQIPKRAHVRTHTQHPHTPPSPFPPILIYPACDSFALGENDFMHHLYPPHICIPNNPLLISRYLWVGWGITMQHIGKAGAALALSGPHVEPMKGRRSKKLTNITYIWLIWKSTELPMLNVTEIPP